jgi:2-methylcitrate dehydratase PrpD
MMSSIDHLLDFAETDQAALPEHARRLAVLSLFDWMTVMIAAVEEPVSRIIRTQALEEGGNPAASVAGSSTKLSARAAALVNGTISHALDYDDTHFAHIGHLSVGIYPAALAAGEEMGARAAEVRDAFLVAAEAACRIGMVLGRGHYQRGFHQTATSGAFGATIAAGVLYGLTRDQMRHALNLVSTRASGLKSQFGTMGKPLNAGIAASNGVEAASLARRGFMSCDDGIFGPQGFVETHADHPDHDAFWRDPPPGRFVFDAINYKLHACCHGTHAMIEALQHMKRRHGLTAADIHRIEVRTHPRWLRVCDIKAPRTGLEVKFSYVTLAAMCLAGINTAAEKSYADALCIDPVLRELAGRVTVTGDDSLGDTAAVVAVETAGGHLEAAHDLSAPIALADLETALRAKADGLIGPSRSAKFWQAMQHLEKLGAAGLGDLIRA